MDDLDSLLQDFSYLKSLEYRDRLPPRVDPKLFLPDPSCIHVLRHLFAATNEIEFARMFKRPIARRLFELFLTRSEEKATDPVAARLVEFCKAVDDIGKTPERGSVSSRKPRSRQSAVATDNEGSLITVQRVYDEFVRDKTIENHSELWKDSSLEAGFVQRYARLQEAAERRADSLKQRDDGGGPMRMLSIEAAETSIMGIFTPYQVEAKEYLAREPWQRFLRSDAFIRYAQWKQLELNMKIGLNDFDIHRILGRGGFGEVYGCRKRDTGALFAIKQLDKKRLKKEGQERSVIHERNVLAEMTSKFVTNLKYAFHDKDKLYLVMDLMEGGDLGFQLKESPEGRFTEYQARFYAAEILRGLAHIHSHGFIYRDLKPANVLLGGDGHARISDLGLARDCTYSWPTSQCGTHGYMAPEVLTKDTPYGFAADWFSFGCVVYEFLVGRTPFQPTNKPKSHKKWSAAVMELTKQGLVECPDHMSPKARAFCTELLIVDPAARLGRLPDARSDWPSVQGHGWFSSIDWEALDELKVPAAIVPRHGQVNAKEIFEIGSDQRARSARRVKVTEEDNKKFYKRFNHIMSHQWQEEVLPMFGMITEAADKLDRKRARRIESHTHLLKGSPSGEVLLEGYMMKLSGTSIMRRWSKRYVHILADRLEWRNEAQMAPKRVLKFTECTVQVEESASSDSIQTIVLTGPDDKEYKLRAYYPSDERFWLEILNGAYSVATGITFLPENYEFYGKSLKDDAAREERTGTRSDQSAAASPMKRSTESSASFYAGKKMTRSVSEQPRAPYEVPVATVPDTVVENTIM